MKISPTAGPHEAELCMENGSVIQALCQPKESVEIFSSFTSDKGSVP